MSDGKQGLSPWWTPDVHADRRPFLMGRNRIVRALRGWFDEQDFIEVDPAALQVSPGNEAHLHAFQADLVRPDMTRQARYLHTSPEFACKKLLAAGEERIVAFSHVWRNREAGPLHHPEFTMLEWYRARQDWTVLMEDCTRLIRLAAETAGQSWFSWKGVTCDPFAEPERLSVADAFARHAGIDLLAAIHEDGTTDRGRLADLVQAAGMRVDDGDSWSDLFSRVMVEKIDPQLGVGRPTILHSYPASEAALSRRQPADPRLAERFELFCATVELANAFGELTDATEQRRRFVADMAIKHQVYGETYPLDEDFLAALAVMPEASGSALGLDRLVMLATGATRIDQVLWAPVGGL